MAPVQIARVPRVIAVTVHQASADVWLKLALEKTLLRSASASFEV